MPVRFIRKSSVTDSRNDAIKAGVPASSVRRALSLITRTLDFAADEDMIAANPAARVKPPGWATRRGRRSSRPSKSRRCAPSR